MTGQAADPDLARQANDAAPQGFVEWGRSLALKRVLESLADRDVAILTQDNPDPDAIGAALGLQRICQHLRPDRKATIYYGGFISHPQNQTMVGVLGINLREMAEFDPGAGDFVILVDASNTGQKNLQSTQVPAGAVFDHHEDRPVGEPEFVDIRRVGATCSIVTEHLCHLGTPIGPNLATALLFGISNDTNHLTSNTTDLDTHAFFFLQPKMDKAMLNELENYRLPNFLFELEQTASENRRVQGKVLVSGLGYVPASKRDGIPHVADRFLRLEEIETVIIHALVGDRLVASFRTTDEALDANRFVQRIFGEKFAGAKAFRGGAQVPLGFLTPGEDLDEGTRNLFKRYVNECVARKVFQVLAQDLSESEVRGATPASSAGD